MHVEKRIERTWCSGRTGGEARENARPIWGGAASFLPSLWLPTLQRADDQQHHQQINPHFQAEETTEKIVPLKNLILRGFT